MDNPDFQQYNFELLQDIKDKYTIKVIGLVNYYISKDGGDYIIAASESHRVATMTDFYEIDHFTQMMVNGESLDSDYAYYYDDKTGTLEQNIDNKYISQ